MALCSALLLRQGVQLDQVLRWPFFAWVTEVSAVFLAGCALGFRWLAIFLPLMDIREGVQVGGLGCPVCRAASYSHLGRIPLLPCLHDDAHASFLGLRLLSCTWLVRFVLHACK